MWPFKRYLIYFGLHILRLFWVMWQLKSNNFRRFLHRSLSFSMILIMQTLPLPLTRQIRLVRVRQVSHLLAGLAVLLLRHLMLPQLLQDEVGGRRAPRLPQRLRVTQFPKDVTHEMRRVGRHCLRIPRPPPRRSAPRCSSRRRGRPRGCCWSWWWLCRWICLLSLGNCSSKEFLWQIVRPAGRTWLLFWEFFQGETCKSFGSCCRSGRSWRGAQVSN